MASDDIGLWLIAELYQRLFIDDEWAVRRPRRRSVWIPISMAKYVRRLVSNNEAIRSEARGTPTRTTPRVDITYRTSCGMRATRSHGQCLSDSVRGRSRCGCG